MSRVMIWLIGVYRRHVSQILGPRCRFYPTCSLYAQQAYVKYGFFKGSYLAVRRILRCHPFHAGGYDPLV